MVLEKREAFVKKLGGNAEGIPENVPEEIPSIGNVFDFTLVKDVRNFSLISFFGLASLSLIMSIKIFECYV